jgi:hypothetical protein
MLKRVVVNAACIRFKLCRSGEGSDTRKAAEANTWENSICYAHLPSKRPMNPQQAVELVASIRSNRINENSSEWGHFGQARRKSDMSMV